MGIAEDDLRAAKVLAKSQNIRAENILFHIEQAIEKAIKAVLCFEGKPVPLTHDLLSLLQKFSSDHLPPGGYALHDLTPFATVRRYVEGVDVFTPEDIQQAMDSAEGVLSWGKQKIKSKK